jgi:DNA (cytosine-5)-methyltransferase 1
MKKRSLNYLDLFAGAGGLSEGFVRAGFSPVAHVEADIAACMTLRTRQAWTWLKSQGRDQVYIDYLRGSIPRGELYAAVPKRHLDSVINDEIHSTNLSGIFNQVDCLLGNNKLDLIVGGPPCQAYSVAGRARDIRKMKGDSRNYLYRYYAEFLKRYRPLYFIFENVTGLLSAKDEDGTFHIDNMRRLFRDTGYETDIMKLSAENYGVLQRRRRVILIGRQGRSSNFYLEPSTPNSTVFVKEVFSDLPFLKAGQGDAMQCKTKSYSGNWLYETGIKNDLIPVSLHVARPHTEQDLRIYSIVVNLWNSKNKRLDYNSLPDYLKTHNNRSSFMDRFKVVAENLPYSQTIVAHIAKDGHYYIHPDIAQNRSITPREAARLQTFPDDYYFESISGKPSRTSAFRQIGNAVPVVLAEKVAKKLKMSW